MAVSLQLFSFSTLPTISKDGVKTPYCFRSALALLPTSFSSLSTSPATVSFSSSATNSASQLSHQLSQLSPPTYSASHPMDLSSSGRRQTSDQCEDDDDHDDTEEVIAVKKMKRTPGSVKTKSSSSVSLDLPDSVMKKRRLAANARERRRMDLLNR